MTFPSVLEVLRGLVVDEGGLDALSAAQKLAIADREVSLAPPDGLSGGAAGGSMPGVASVRAGASGGSPQPAAVPAATGMPSGM